VRRLRTRSGAQSSAAIWREQQPERDGVRNRNARNGELQNQLSAESDEFLLQKRRGWVEEKRAQKSTPVLSEKKCLRFFSPDFSWCIFGFFAVNVQDLDCVAGLPELAFWAMGFRGSPVEL
jgi:hypothetical protein